jgi:hypothetical protein
LGVNNAVADGLTVIYAAFWDIQNARVHTAAGEIRCPQLA